MTIFETDEKPPVEGAVLAEVAELLGAPRTFRKVPRNQLETHEMLLKGLPAVALMHLVGNLGYHRWNEAYAKAIGMS